MITKKDRLRGARQSRPPSLAVWLFPAAFVALALGRMAQVQSLANRFSMDSGDILALLRLSESARIARSFKGHEVVIIEHVISVGLLLSCATLLVFILLVWRGNARFQARLWSYVQELEHRGPAA